MMNEIEMLKNEKEKDKMIIANLEKTNEKIKFDLRKCQKNEFDLKE